MSAVQRALERGLMPEEELDKLVGRIRYGPEGDEYRRTLQREIAEAQQRYDETMADLAQQQRERAATARPNLPAGERARLEREERESTARIGETEARTAGLRGTEQRAGAAADRAGKLFAATFDATVRDAQARAAKGEAEVAAQTLANAGKALANEAMRTWGNPEAEAGIQAKYAALLTAIETVNVSRRAAGLPELPIPPMPTRPGAPAPTPPVAGTRTPPAPTPYVAERAKEEAGGLRLQVPGLVTLGNPEEWAQRSQSSARAIAAALANAPTDQERAAIASSLRNTEEYQKMRAWVELYQGGPDKQEEAVRSIVPAGRRWSASWSRKEWTAAARQAYVVYSAYSEILTRIDHAARTGRVATRLR